LTVPLLRNGVALGAIAVGGPKPGLLSNAQVAVIRTFADQAVIAIENVRLFTALETRNHELSESLEQQTATAEILGVISRSPTDTQPVFDGIVASAVRLCDARMGAIYRIDHDVIDVVATADMNDEARETHQAPYPMPVADLQLPFRRAIATGERLHVVDVDTELGFSESFRERARTLGYRSALMVPMCREGRVIGTINVGRIGAGGVPRPFSDREIGLLQTFADQAVIAIENVRLFQELEARNRELTESLEQQTATSEILRVISSSPTDLLPVFDAILRSVVTLCAGYYSLLFLFDGERLDLAATHNVPPDGLDALKRRYPMSIGSDEGGLTAQAVRERRLLHVTDLQSDPRVPAGARLASEAVGQRAAVAVPMFRKDEPVGALTVSRQDPRAFSERELALLQTFAAQAVIAIENVRLFQELETRNRELSEALEQQTATAEILGVISRSPTDLQPVLNAVARNASRLCGAANVSLYRIEGNLMRKVAEEGLALTMLRVGEARPITRTTISGRALVDRTTIHLPDYQSPEAVRDYPDVRRDTGIRTTIGIPLLREGIAIGAFTAYRTEPRAFAEREIALLQTFADQAVIAIENVRLFQELEARNRELTESLEQQTATGEILRVISSSPTDFAPVMTAVTQNAARLARADHALIGEAAEGRIRWLATSGCPLVSEGPSISRQLPSGRAILDCQTTQVEDVTDLTVDFPGVRRAYEEFGVRTILATPLVREGQAIGVLLVRRTRVQPFTGKEVELLRTFADQAVIAIENVRLFTELEARNRELTESLEQQTATSEILGAISASPTDVQPVFDTIVESVARLCDGVYTTLFRFDGELIYPAAYHRSIGPEGQGIHERMYPRPPSRDSVVARAVLDRAVVRVADIEKDADVPSDTRELARTVGYQSVLAVPMLREGTPIGALGIGRRSLAGRVRPFSEREIALVRTFADQAVIAIENVRLFQELAARNRELTEALEQQTATSEILRVI
jgi:GAF domain-containing protein